MSSFTDRPILTPLHSGREWVVRKEFVYEIGKIGSGSKIIILEGFMTDFASTPRLIWSIFPPFGIYLQAAILHDYLYWEQYFSRKRSDDIFLEAMEVLEVDKVTRGVLYRSVRSFGSFAWNANAKDKASGKKKIINLPEF